jgi:hypothetical protein
MLLHFFKLGGIRLGLAVGLAGSVAGPALAGEPAALTGLEVARDSQYAYLGVVLPLPGQDPGRGLVQRYWLDYLTYRYEKTPTQDIDAEVLGGEAALGYQKSSERGGWGVYLGARYADTRLDPDDLSHEGRGGHWYAKLQLDGEVALGQGWRLGGIVSHVVDHDAFWARVRLQTPLAQRWQVGPEFIAQGDPNYRAYKLGVFVGNIRVGTDSALTLKAGASKSEDDSASPYAGVELYLPF